jgi:hypothetical protein
MDELMRIIMQAQAEQQQVIARSPYLPQFREEHRVIPALCGLPRIIRAFLRG